jgi:hypothetical protein
LSTALAALPTQNGVAINPLNDVIDVVKHLDKLKELAKTLIASGMIPTSIKTPEAAVAIMLKGRELGIGAMHAFDSITVIQGKPSASPQLMIALINRSGLCENIHITDDGVAAFVTMKRKGRDPHTERYGMDDADIFMTQEWVNNTKRTIPLSEKHNWKSQPITMRKWRAVAACSRVVFPDVIAGMYTPEEMGANVNEDGEIIEGEIVEAYVPAPSLPDNGSGYGRTNAYASPEQTRAYETWLAQRLKNLNEAWDAVWANRHAKGKPIPAKIQPLLNSWGATGHLLKWAITSEHLDPGIVPADHTSPQKSQFVAIVFHRSEEDRASLKAELFRYAAEQKRLKEDAVFRKNPDMAPEGWAEEQAEANARASEEDGPEVAYVAPQATKRMTKKELAELMLKRQREASERADIAATTQMPDDAPLLPDEEDEDESIYASEGGREG